MIIRIGFVSNSSSSSFIIIGREIDVKEAEKLLGESRILVDTDLHGSEGDIIIDLEDKKTLKVLKEAVDGKFNFTSVSNYNYTFHPKFYEVFAGKIQDDYELEFNASELPPIKCKAYFLTVDYHTPVDAKELREKYDAQKDY